MEMINLTSHPVRISTEGKIFEIKPSGTVARLIERYGQHRKVTADGEKITIVPVKNVDIFGLPNPKPQTYYIVSSMVAFHAKRKDVLCPGEFIKDTRGKIIASKWLLSTV